MKKKAATKKAATKKAKRGLLRGETKYRPAYCDQAIECLAEGRTIASFAGLIGVGRATVYRWRKEFPEFDEAMEIGRSKTAYFWEGELIRKAKGGEGDSTPVIFALKNCAREEWTDRTITEHTGPGGGPVQIDDKTIIQKAMILAAALETAGRLLNASSEN